MITSIIFSKDRPLQLDLCLQSIYKNLKSSTRNIVIYKCSNERYQASYDGLRTAYPDVEFWPQGKSLLKDVYHSILTESNNGYVCFFVDDCIVYRDPNINIGILDSVFYNEDVCCMSLRLGFNINQRTHGNMLFQDQIHQHQVINKEWVAFPKTSVAYGNYWSYSLSVDGHIFRKHDMQKMVNELIYISDLYKEWKNTPNTFEAELQRFWTISPPIMICPIQSCVVNSPNNKVQESHNNTSGDLYSYDQEELLNIFLSGKRIDLDKLDIKDINCPHTEIDILKGLS